MPHDRYPRGQDLRELLLEAGMEVKLGVMIPNAVAAGIQAFENLTQRHFLAGKEIDNTPDTPVPQTRVFDCWQMNEGLLDFGQFGDLVGVPDDTITVSYQPVSGTPTPMTFRTQYELEEANAPSIKKPYTRLRVLRPGAGWGWFSTSDWASPFFGHRGSFSITGLWGHWTTIPDDAWYAMLFAGALEYFDPGSVVGSTRNLKLGVKSWSGPGGVQTVYDTTWHMGLRERWGQGVQAAVQTYQRWSL